MDAAGRIAVFALGGRLVPRRPGDRRDDRAGGRRPGRRPAPGPDRRSGSPTSPAAPLHVIEPDGTDGVLAGEAGVTWGLAEFIAAEEFDRFRGYWWSPDGRSVLAAGSTSPGYRGWHLHDPAEPDEPPHGRLPARRHRQRRGHPAPARPRRRLGRRALGPGDLPVPGRASWSEQGGPLITVLRRLQQHGLVLAVDPRTGETQVHAELADPRWVEPVAGTPGAPRRRAGAGRRRAGPRRLRRPVPVRRRQPDHPAPPLRAAGLRPAPARRRPADLLVEASEGEPSEQHVYRVRHGHRRAGAQSPPDHHRARLAHRARGGDTCVVGSLSLEHAGWQCTVRQRRPVGGRAPLVGRRRRPTRRGRCWSG